MWMKFPNITIFSAKWKSFSLSRPRSKFSRSSTRKAFSLFWKLFVFQSVVHTWECNLWSLRWRCEHKGIKGSQETSLKMLIMRSKAVIKHQSNNYPDKHETGGLSTQIHPWNKLKRSAVNCMEKRVNSTDDGREGLKELVCLTWFRKGPVQWTVLLHRQWSKKFRRAAKLTRKSWRMKSFKLFVKFPSEIFFRRMKNPIIVALMMSPDSLHVHACLAKTR